jgi:hypothetical protein
MVANCWASETPPDESQSILDLNLKPNRAALQPISHNESTIENTHTTTIIKILSPMDFGDFEIPYVLFGTTINESIKNGVYLEPRELEIVTRVLVEEMRLFSTKFGRTECRTVVRKMSRECKSSFLLQNGQGVFDMESDVGLISRLNNRNNYLNRSTTERNDVQKTKIPANKRKLTALLNSTTAEWAPPRPANENEATIREKQLIMQQLFLKKAALTNDFCKYEKHICRSET